MVRNAEIDIFKKTISPRNKTGKRNLEARSPYHLQSKLNVEKGALFQISVGNYEDSLNVSRSGFRPFTRLGVV